MALLKIVDHYVGHTKYTRALLMACGLLIVVAAIGLGYRWYRTSYNQRAHVALAEAIELFDRATKESTEALWDEADRALSKGYADYSGASLAPYFLAFRAQVALQKQGSAEQARDFLKKALQEMSASLPFYDAYEIQLARMNIDSGVADLEQTGRATLEEFANDEENPARDMALYYLGLHSFETGDREQAVKIWTALFDEYVDSLWAQAAQAKLAYQA